MKRVDFLLDEDVVLVERTARERSLSKPGPIREALQGYLEVARELPPAHTKANQKADR